MPLNATGEIPYQPASIPDAMQCQVDPPVCNLCWQEITRQNLGWVSVVQNTHTRGRFECIECTTCTATRAGGSSITVFWARHTR